VQSRESGFAEGEMGRWVVEEKREGEGGDGSIEVARWIFERRDLRKAIDLQLYYAIVCREGHFDQNDQIAALGKTHRQRS
jgi:hypothetical protein